VSGGGNEATLISAIPAPLQRLALVMILLCTSALAALGPGIYSATVASARVVGSPVSTGQPCEWQVTVPLRPLAVVPATSFVQANRDVATLAHPTLVVSPTSIAIGNMVVIVGRHFNRSRGAITIHAEIPEFDMLFEVHGTTRIRVDAAGTLTSRLYLPYGIPTGRATLYVEQRGQVVAQIRFRVTAPLASPPPMNPFNISRMLTFGPAGHEVTSISPHEPVTVRTWWKTGYVDYITSFQFSIRVSVFHGQWHSFGLVGQSTFIVTYQKQFCFVLTPPTGTYSELRVHLTLRLLEGALSSTKWKQSRTVTIAVHG
jgi:hypothetical protein